MKPTVFTPLAAMCSTMASAIMRSFCAVLNTQRRLSSTGETIFSLAAKAIIGTLASATTSIIARALGETVEPITTSTWFSAMSLRVLLTALVVSDASSSTRYSIFWPAISRGRRSTVFLFRHAERSGRPGGRYRHAHFHLRQRQGATERQDEAHD